MAFIETVLGKIDPSNIGKTDAHDHLIRKGGCRSHRQWKRLRPCPTRIKALEELELFKQVGGNTLVEMTPIGSGRSIESLREISAKSGVNIIATTGFHKSEFYDKSHFLWKYDTEQLAELLVADVCDGIDIYDYAGPIVKRSEGRAGVIKAACSLQSITTVEKKELRAAAIASNITGAPVSLHLEKGTMALEAIDILLENGAKPNNIILGHIDRNPDYYYHEQIAKRGVFLIYDGAAVLSTTRTR